MILGSGAFRMRRGVVDSQRGRHFFLHVGENQAKQTDGKVHVHGEQLAHQASASVRRR